MGETLHKSLILILAREFASKLATATFISDAAGRLVYYNEPAERILGRTFAEAGEMPAELLQLAAESMTLGDQIGTLKAGYEADIVAVTGDPVKDITKLRDVTFVMKGGRVFKK